MTQKYIEGDIVEYDNKIMVVKEPRDGSHFDLSCPKEGFVYCFAGVDEIKPVRITPEILKKNGWSINGKYALKIKNANYVVLEFTEDGIYTYIKENNMLFTIKYIHELQHLFFGLGMDSSMIV